MKWKVRVEGDPDVFNYVTTALVGTTLINGIAVFDDGFAADGSDWGDDESTAIANQQALWQSLDPDGNCFACVWAGP